MSIVVFFYLIFNALHVSLSFLYQAEHRQYKGDTGQRNEYDRRGAEFRIEPSAEKKRDDDRTDHPSRHPAKGDERVMPVRLRIFHIKLRANPHCACGRNRTYDPCLIRTVFYH